MEDNLNAHYIKSNKELNAMIEHLESAGVSKVGLDFETASKNGRFGVQNGSVRLIQVAIGEEGVKPEQFVIDCHSCDANKITPLLKDNKIEKQILNLGFEQTWAVSQLGSEIKNIYDPMWAWRVIQKEIKDMDPDKIEKIIPGYKPHGNSLAELSEIYLGINLPKDEQASNWASKTLSTSQIVYAANDSSIMLPLTEITKEVVSQLGLENKVKEAIESSSKSTVKRSKSQTEQTRDDSERLMIALRRAQNKQVLEDIYRSGQVLSIHDSNKKKIKSIYNKRLKDFK